MLSKDEKRFVRYWQDQRADGRLKYYLLYILIGGFIVSIFAFIILLFFFQVTYASTSLVGVFSASVFISFLLTHYGWTKNEKKFKSLIKREIKTNREGNDEFDDEMIRP